MAAPTAEHRWLRGIAGRAGRHLAGAEPAEILAWADHSFGASLALTSSMADAVLAQLAARYAPDATVVFLDTGYHFAETLGTRDAVAATIPLQVLSVRPQQTVAEQDAAYGERLHDRDPDLCCSLRKVAPLEQALAPYRAWMSGIRRDESEARQHTQAVTWDERKGMVKVNPLAYWTAGQVEDYIAEHAVLVNPLTQQGYPSIGCAPCTRWVEPGADARSGRWAGLAKTECGLHA